MYGVGGSCAVVGAAGFGDFDGESGEQLGTGAVCATVTFTERWHLESAERRAPIGGRPGPCIKREHRVPEQS
jgi:hypothetical protein